MNRPTFTAVFALCSAPIFATAPVNLARAIEPPADTEPIRFGRDVLPILSDRCFHCHGPDAERRQADLRLDQRESAVDEMSAVIPGEPDASELIARMTTDDADLLMPPPDSHRKPLTKAEIDVIWRWIAEGAPWGKHWSFEKPIKPSIGEAEFHPIDALVRKRLRREGLTPAPQADRRTLIRRLTLDLIGLPPTPDEVNAFLADGSPGAYERLVDRLLASKHYGERMAWPWLDAARYADTSGFQGDPERSMWPWRDWVIDALNDNMPFDRFTIEQLAGDLLEAPTPEQRLATGFNRNHMHNGEGGRIAEETRVENVFDRTETTGTVWLGMTLQCARCHDHKFDPTSNRDYFAFFDFFNQTSESGGGNRGSAIPPSLDYLPATDRQRLQAAREDVNRLKRELLKPSDAADLAQGEWERQRGTRTPRWPPINPTEATSQTGATIDTLDDSEPLDKFRSSLTDIEQPESKGAEIDEWLAVPQAERGDADRARVREYFRLNEWPAAAGLARRWDAAKSTLAKLEKQIKPTPVMVMDTAAKRRQTLVLVQGVYNNATDQQVAADVPAMLPPLPPKDDQAHYTRLDLARWIVSPDNPLTARVIVNRYWQLFFGRGIVSTPSDFGLQGAQPTHPELLDWLAVEFVESGWDVKRMHRLIVTSATYRQSARVTAESLGRDPQNELLARGSRYRMPSWMIRDASLATSGLLSREMGGPPVKSYQPDGIWAEATFGKIKYRPDSGSALYRRSLYSFWRRIVGPTVFFDAAKRQTCEVEPNLTNTPLHALTTLNDITFVEAARVMAENLIQNHPTDRDQINAAFLILVSRPPVAEELALLQNRLESTREAFANDPDEAQALLAVGQSPRDTSLDVAQQAALTTVINTLMNLDEFLVKP